MPPRRAVELRVGGQTYRVVATDNDQNVQRLADLVDRKFAEVVPQGRGVTVQQAMFLTAMALAEEAEEQRTRAARLELERDRSLHLATRAREAVARLLKRVDNVLSGAPEPKTAAPPAEPRIPTPLDHLTDPPDVLHEPFLLELMPPSTRDSSFPAWTSAQGAANTPAWEAPAASADPPAEPAEVRRQPRSSPGSPQRTAPGAPAPGLSPAGRSSSSAHSPAPAPSQRGGLRLVRPPTDDDSQ